MNFSGSETTDHAHGTNPGPKRFIFDVPDDKLASNNTELDEMQQTKEDSGVAESLPFLTGFPEPVDYREGYTSLVNNVLGVYNHVRSLIAGEYYGELKEVIEKIKIEQPRDCLVMLRDLFANCLDKIPIRLKGRNREEGTDTVNNYEDLLQKAEAKIRVFIRNEQIFRLNFDILTQRIEDSDKGLCAAQYEINMSKAAYDALAKENAELSAKVQQMTNELTKVQKEYEDIEKKYKDARVSLNTVENHDLINSGTDRKTPASQNWDHQIMNVALKESKVSSVGITARLHSDVDKRVSWGEMTQTRPSTKYLVTERSQERRANITGTSFLNTSTEHPRKAERSKNSSLINDLKKTIDSHRTALNVSSDMGLNRSTERSQERNTIFNTQRRNPEQPKTGSSQEQIRIKIPVRDRKLGEYTDRDFASFLANKTTLQKISSISNKFPIQVGPSSTRRSRDGSTLARNLIPQTEQSPDARSHDSKTLRTQGNSQGLDLFNSPYATTYRQKTIDLRDERSYTKGSTKTSFLIKDMIAEQLGKKINGNKFS